MQLLGQVFGPPRRLESKNVSLLRDHVRLGGHSCRDNGGQKAVRPEKIGFSVFFFDQALNRIKSNHRFCVGR
jgi:hypothetical protein